MSCNCEGNTYHIGMGCCVPVVANADNYYTKSEVDEKIDNIDVGSGITPSEVQALIDDSLVDYYDKTTIDNWMQEKASQMELLAMEQAFDLKLNDKLDITAYTPTDLSGYATQEWVNNQGYLTQHQPLKTINGQSLIGNGNIDISGGGSADLSNYYNKQEVDDKLDLKANTSDALKEVLVTEMGLNYTQMVNRKLNGNLSAAGFFRKINGKEIASSVINDVSDMLSLVETSAITTALTSESTNAQVPSSKATYDALNTKANASDLSALNTTVGQLSTTVENKADSANVYTKTEVNNLVNNKFWCGTQSQYDALTNKENDVLYLIYEV